MSGIQETSTAAETENGKYGGFFVPEGQLKIAQHFSAGYGPGSAPQSRRDG